MLIHRPALERRNIVNEFASNVERHRRELLLQLSLALSGLFRCDLIRVAGSFKNAGAEPRKDRLQRSNHTFVSGHFISR